MAAQRVPEGVLLSAQLRLSLPAAMDEALRKSIPMSFVLEAALLRSRWYWYDKELASATRHLRLSFQPLTRRWRVTVSNTPIGQTGLALGQSYDTLEEALGSMQRISGWKIADAGVLDEDPRAYVNLRFRLDTSQLPRPFQIGVAGQSHWDFEASRSVRVGAPAEGEAR